MFKTQYGYFNAEGDEFVITRPDTPKPWANVICPGDYGLVVSQTGGGYSWKTHASLNRITRWNQDLVSDQCGKYIYIRDEKTGEFWSATVHPVKNAAPFYECRHGVGYTRFKVQEKGIESELTFFVPPGKPLEVWDLKITNSSNQKRTLSLWSYLEWCLGESPDNHREFHKTFLETELDRSSQTILASKRLWTIVNKKGQHWNRSWDYVAWHSVNLPLKDYCGHKDSFLGRYRSVQNPQALAEGKMLGSTSGKWDDSIGSLCVEVSLLPGETKRILWTLGIASSKKEAVKLSQEFKRESVVDPSFVSARKFWKDYLNLSEVS
ncbi:MAG: glycosyl transferase family 36, partial [Elusimicrobia bacterium]|nr:glycosyl transferase family 36 [Elusimicrobiota bacterium]